ncbi:hypothetical protein DMO16_09485 [Fictibacillus sp. S7]|nr:hypothetical protein DMO16_09485 [Fictibacillus sp. S7]
MKFLGLFLGMTFLGYFLMFLTTHSELRIVLCFAFFSALLLRIIIMLSDIKREIGRQNSMLEVANKRRVKVERKLNQ